MVNEDRTLPPDQAIVNALVELFNTNEVLTELNWHSSTPLFDEETMTPPMGYVYGQGGTVVQWAFQGRYNINFNLDILCFTAIGEPDDDDRPIHRYWQEIFNEIIDNQDGHGLDIMRLGREQLVDIDNFVWGRMEISSYDLSPAQLTDHLAVDALLMEVQVEYDIIRDTRRRDSSLNS